MTFKKEIQHVVNVIASPAEVFADVREDPKWRAPLMFNFVTAVFIGWMKVPLLVGMMRRVYESTFGGEGAAAAIAGTKTMVIVAQLVVGPATGIVRWLLFSSAVWILLRLSQGTAPSFRNIFCIAAYSESIQTLMNLVSVLILHLRDPESLSKSSDLVVFRGLDWFLPAAMANHPIGTFLSPFEPFAVWYLITLGIGVRVMSGTEKVRAFMIAMGGWLVIDLIGTAGTMIHPS